MNEIITVNGVAYTVQNVTTGANSISFVLTNLTIEEAETAFKSAESLTVGTEEETYGNYPNVSFESVARMQKVSYQLQCTSLQKRNYRLRNCRYHRRSRTRQSQNFTDWGCN